MIKIFAGLHHDDELPLLLHGILQSLQTTSLMTSAFWFLPEALRSNSVRSGARRFFPLSKKACWKWLFVNTALVQDNLVRGIWMAENTILERAKNFDMLSVLSAADCKRPVYRVKIWSKLFDQGFFNPQVLIPLVERIRFIFYYSAVKTPIVVSAVDIDVFKPLWRKLHSGSMKSVFKQKFDEINACLNPSDVLSTPSNFDLLDIDLDDLPGLNRLWKLFSRVLAATARD